MIFGQNQEVPAFVDQWRTCSVGGLTSSNAWKQETTEKATQKGISFNFPRITIFFQLDAMLQLWTNMNCAKHFIKVFETLYSCTALLGPHLCIVKPKYLQHITGLSHYVQLQRLGLNLGQTKFRDLPKPHLYFQHSAKAGSGNVLLFPQIGKTKTN